MANLAAILVFLLFSLIFVGASLLGVRLLAPRAPMYEKGVPYECGEIPEGSPWIRFNPRYYIVALVFVIFDVEIALIYPCAVVFRDWVAQGAGRAVLFEVFSFLAILIVGLAYAWKKGDLEWIRTLSTADAEKKAA